MKEAQAEQAQKERIDALSPIGSIIAILLFLGWFPLIIFIYFKYDRELKHSFEGKYFRELPGEYTPAETSILMSFGYVQSRDIMATLMDLVRKKLLKLSINKVYKKGLFGGKEITEYVFSINEGADVINLKRHEQFLINWFVNKIGNGMAVDIDEIKEYVKNRHNALQFKSDYDQWIKHVKSEAEGNGFFDNTCKKGRIIGVFSGLIYLGLCAALTFLMYAPIAIIPAVQGIILVLFSARIKRRTAYGNEQHAMWHAFRNFLKDFSRLDKAEIPSIVIWEHYLVYAISLGVAKDVIKQLPLVFNDADLDNSHLTFMHGASYGYLAGFSTMFDNTIHTVESSINSAVNIANSANSSSSGSGGGFSGGSSGGGGGSSGGAF